MPRVLTRNDIINASDRAPLPVTVPEWREPGETEAPTVFVRRLTGAERQILNKKFGTDPQQDVAELQAFAFIVSDETGKPLFTDEDTRALAEKNGTAIARVARRALFINGYGTAALDEHEKNS